MIRAVMNTSNNTYYIVGKTPVVLESVTNQILPHYLVHNWVTHIYVDKQGIIVSDNVEWPICMEYLKMAHFPRLLEHYPDSKVHGANMGPIWVLSAPDAPHVDPMNLAIRVVFQCTNDRHPWGLVAWCGALGGNIQSG